MKKRLRLVIAVAVIAVCFSNVSAEAADDIKVYLNNEHMTFEVAPYMKNDRVMVPMRDIFERLDSVVSWDVNTQSVTAEKDGLTVILGIGMDTMYVGGVPIYLEAVPELTNDKTFVPLRAVSEALDCAVDWDGTKKRVDIVYKWIRQGVYYSEFSSVADFGAYFGISPVSVVKDTETNGYIYNYDISSVEPGAAERYLDILKSSGFINVNGNGYVVSAKDSVTVLTGKSGGIFRIVVYTD